MLQLDSVSMNLEYHHDRLTRHRRPSAACRVLRPGWTSALLFSKLIIRLFNIASPDQDDSAMFLKVVEWFQRRKGLFVLVRAATMETPTSKEWQSLLRRIPVPLDELALETHKLLFETFNRDELKELLFNKFGVRLNRIANSTAENTVVALDVVEWFERNERLQELVDSSASARPNVAQWQALRTDGHKPSIPEPVRPDPASPYPEWTTNMPIPGLTIEEICNAFEQAYDRNDIQEMLRKRLSESLDHMTGPNTTWHKAVFDVFEWSERKGPTIELIRAGHEFNPTHRALQAVYQRYGLTGIDLQVGGRQVEPLKASEGGFEKTIKARLPQLDFSVWRTRMTEVEGRVCLVEIDSNPAGTGFLVGPSAVLTNYHVLEELFKGNVPAAKVTCRFDYKMLADKSKVEGIVVKLHETDWKLDFSPFASAEKTRYPDNPLPTADELDYALVRLISLVGEVAFTPKGGAESRKRGWLTLPAGPLAFTKGMPLIIAQHPNGMPLKVAFWTRTR